MAILQSNLSPKTVGPSAVELELNRLREENARLKAENANRQRLSVKVSPTTGTVCVYGLQRMPVSLYAGQWERLIAYIPTLQAYIESNPDGMARKG